jgi:hypothetical protein
MNEAVQNLLILNIGLFCVAAIALTLMILWSRTTRGVWPGRTKVVVLAGVNLVIWFFGNIMYFYFRSH